MTSHILVSIRVAATPSRAFEVFTREIGAWWQPNGLFRFTHKSPGQLKFETRPGGCLVEILPDGEIYEIGQITAGSHLRDSPLPGVRRALRGANSPNSRCASSRWATRLGSKSNTTVGTRFPLSMSPGIIFRTRSFLQRHAEWWQVLLLSFNSRLLLSGGAP
jgi:hypothetical protein